MRILHVLDHSIPLHSGYAFRTLAILREQRALGWETAQLTSAKHHLPCPEVEEVDGFTFYRTATLDSIIERLPLGNHAGVIRGLYRRLVTLIPALKPDLIHAHSPVLTGVPAIRAARRLGLPVVYEMRASWEDGAVDHGTARAGDWRYRLSRLAETWVLRHADAVTTICEGLRKEIIARGIEPDKVTVVPNAVDPLRFAMDGVRDPALARSLNLDGARVIGFIGSFYAYEGLALLVKVMPEILTRMPDVRLLLVGGGYEEKRLKQQAEDMGIADTVVFAGRIPHDRVQRYYDLVDVFVYPRERTRLTELVTPLKPLEAMAQGRSVIASDVGGHRELIRHGETGLMFRAGQADSLADSIMELMQKPELAAAMRAKARRFVETERTWAASVARYGGVYDALLRAKRSVPAGVLHPK
ncbi:MAG TPA: TIGR04063 family PEP-CTERM/XrtA system glycosyltransferase [Burkholderiales bacterium]|nr:TIGR04063 family PEP-CTERM/XrtA system glycosyltransferase [Burkholderiales bacterium]